MMKSIEKHELYRNQLERCLNDYIDWNYYREKTILISGATGMIGHTIIDLIMRRNDLYQTKIHVAALSRSLEKVKERFPSYLKREEFHYVLSDLEQEIEVGELKIDYIIHAASSTHPIQYAQDPIGTISANVIGTKNLLEYAVRNKVSRVVFLSSVEVYGENRGDVDLFKEDYCGYIDCNTLRAGYPESKRTGEALCQAYLQSKNLSIVIPRLSRVYGPTMLTTDSKAIAQFIKRAVEQKEIILKSSGTQKYSYTYVVDAAMAILFLLQNGRTGEVYNVAEDSSNITLYDLAMLLAQEAGTKVVMECPDDIENKGYSTATKAMLDSSKIKELGFSPKVSMMEGIQTTLKVLRDLVE